jgi:hypothetical protein
MSEDNVRVSKLLQNIGVKKKKTRRKRTAPAAAESTSNMRGFFKREGWHVKGEESELYDCYSCKFREDLTDGLAHCHKIPPKSHAIPDAATRHQRAFHQQIWLPQKERQYASDPDAKWVVMAELGADVLGGYPYKFLPTNILACSNYKRGSFKEINDENIKAFLESHGIHAGNAEVVAIRKVVTGVPISAMQEVEQFLVSLSSQAIAMCEEEFL